jgi:hypothetical protein
MKRLLDKIRARTGRNRAGRDIRDVIADLNPLLRRLRQQRCARDCPRDQHLEVRSRETLPAAQLVRVMPMGITCYAGTAPAGEPPDGRSGPVRSGSSFP